MAGFTGFPFSNSSLPAFPPFAASSASSGSNPTSSSSTSTSFNFGSTSTPSFGSSSAPTDEATIKKIVEALELLEKLAKNGVFPQEKLEEIKRELAKMYPNIFNKKAQNNSQGNNPQKPPAGSYSPYSFTSSYANTNMFQQLLQQRLQGQQQQQELIKQYTLIYQQQLNHHIQAQKQLMQQEYMKAYQTAAAGFSPYNIYGNHPSYSNYHSFNSGQTTGDALNMVLGVMGQSNNGGLMSNILGSTGLGSDGFSSLSFLGSLLGGFVL